MYGMSCLIILDQIFSHLNGNVAHFKLYCFSTVTALCLASHVWETKSCLFLNEKKLENSIFLHRFLKVRCLRNYLLGISAETQVLYLY